MPALIPINAFVPRNKHQREKVHLEELWLLELKMRKNPKIVTQSDDQYQVKYQRKEIRLTSSSNSTSVISSSGNSNYNPVIAGQSLSSSSGKAEEERKDPGKRSEVAKKKTVEGLWNRKKR